MDWLNRWIEEHLGRQIDLDPRMVASVAMVALILVARWFILTVINRRTQDVRIRYRWRKTTLYIGVGIGLLLLGRIWLPGFHSLATYLGLVSAGLTIALQTPIMNFAGWIFIMWRRPFVVGDRLEIAGQRGDVIDQRIFMFTMMEIGNWVNSDQSTGRVIHVPNGLVFSEAISNYTQGFHYIWDEIPVLITFESNWREAKRALMDIAHKHAEGFSHEAERRVREAAKRFMIFYTKLTPTVYTSVEDSGVLLTLRFLSEPRRRRSVREAIWEDILDLFAQADDIDFAYPTQRFYSNPTEGKPGARADVQGPERSE